MLLIEAARRFISDAAVVMRRALERERKVRIVTRRVLHKGPYVTPSWAMVRCVAVG